VFHVAGISIGLGMPWSLLRSMKGLQVIHCLNATQYHPAKKIPPTGTVTGVRSAMLWLNLENAGNPVGWSALRKMSSKNFGLGQQGMGKLVEGLSGQAGWPGSNKFRYPEESVTYGPPKPFGTVHFTKNVPLP